MLGGTGASSRRAIQLDRNENGVCAGRDSAAHLFEMQRHRLGVRRTRKTNPALAVLRANGAENKAGPVR